MHPAHRPKKQQQKDFIIMRKIIIPLFFILPAMGHAQTVLTPQEQVEKAQKQLEEAQKALEAAKKAAEDAKKATGDKQQKADGTTSPSHGWSVPAASTTKMSKKKEKEKKNNDKEDPKYLAGAVTTNAEGKVEFDMETDAGGKSADQIYDIVYGYMTQLTQQQNNVGSRMALVNKDEHIIVNTMDEWLVFSSSFVSLDRTECKYQLRAHISDNHLRLNICRIFFSYEANRATGFKEQAENVITDDVALNKKKTALARTFGKFRKKMIDRKDQIFSELEELVKQ